MNNIELRAERAKLLTQLGEVYAAAEKEGRGELSAEEKTKSERMKADAADLKLRYERMEEVEGFKKELSETQGRVDPTQSRSSLLADNAEGEAYRKAFREYIRTGVKRDLNTTTPADGGYSVPVEIAKDIVFALNRGSVVRQAGASVLSTTKRTSILVSPQITGTWEPERDAYNNGADSDNAMAVFAAQPRKYTVRQTISEELLLDSGVDVEAMVTKLFVEAYAQAADNAYVNGTGSGNNQPNGALSGATDKVVVSATTATAAEIKAHFAALPAQYRRDPSCAWIASDEFIQHVASLAVTPSNGLIFKYGEKAGDPDYFMNKPIYSSAAVDTSWSAGAEIAFIGAMKFYQIVDFTSYSAITRLSELSALTGAVQMIARYATDGKFLVADAGRVLKLAAS